MAGKKWQSTPKEQASKAGNGGVVPPPEHRWKPGQSGNPEGRATAGATIREHLNAFAEQGLSEAQLRKIARGKAEPWPRRAAAERILRTLEAGDLSDFTAVLEGEKTIDQLRDEGVNTVVVKKCNSKVRHLKDGSGDAITEIEREIELHDRAGHDFDRVMDRTDDADAPGAQKFAFVKVLRGVSMDDL